MNRKNYSYDDVKNAVLDSRSIANVLRLLGLAPKGGNYSTIKKYLENNDIDTSHFTGRGHNVGENYSRIVNEIPIEKYLVNGLKTSSNRLKNRLIEKGVKEHKCECCGNVEWLGNPTPLELHHIDGNPYNNELVNLQLLCPNCHAITPNYRGKNKQEVFEYKTIVEMYPELFVKKDIYKCEKDNTIDKDTNTPKMCSCGKVIDNRSTKCVECSHLDQRKVLRPTHQQLEQDVSELGYRGTGRKYGVSDNTIRKWLNPI